MRYLILALSLIIVGCGSQPDPFENSDFLKAVEEKTKVKTPGARVIFQQGSMVTVYAVQDGGTTVYIGVSDYNRHISVTK